jgi:DNA-binding response OmpR family regulator/HD-like signal output (HDOD) protein
MIQSNPRVDAWWRRIAENDLLPRPQGSALALWQALERENADLAELARLAQGDPVLASRLLKLANSAAYGGQRPAVAIGAEVLMRLGLSTVRQLLLAFLLLDRFRAGRCSGFAMQRFWQQALVQAVLAQHLGSRVRAAPPSECFTLGLLFDLGTLLLAESDEEACGVAGAEALDLPPRGRLLRHYGVSTLHLTARLAQWLGLPSVFVEAIAFCASEEDGAAQAASARAQRIAQVLCLAQHLAAQVAPGTIQTQPAAVPSWATALALTAEDLQDVAAIAGQEWPEWCALLGLPRPEASAEPQHAHAATDDELTVLVIDDDPALRRLCERLLAKPRRRVCTFASGSQALAWLADNPADAALVDLLLPGDDGWQLIRKLRALPIGDSLHIVVLSVLADRHAIERAFAAGADDFLTKPFDAGLIESRLLPALRRKRAHKSPQAEAPQPPLIDPATRLLNRSDLEIRLEQELALASRLNRPLALLGVRFAGPAALSAHAARLRQVLRAADMHGLWDAQTVWLLLPATDEPGVRRVAQRLDGVFAAQAGHGAEGPQVFWLTWRAGGFAAEPASGPSDWRQQAQAFLTRFAAAGATPPEANPT